MCVFCGASTPQDPAILAAMEALIDGMGERGIGLVYGGGRVGLMGLAADRMRARGGHVLGVIPRQLEERELAHDGLDELIVVESMHERKRIMYDRSDAFIAFPGGFGTLDELFEVLTLQQTGKVRKRPVILVGREFWRRLIDFDWLVETGVISPGDDKLFQIVDSAEEAWAVLCDCYGFDAPPTQTGDLAVDI